MHATYPADGLGDARVDHRLDADRLATAEVRAAYGCSQAAAGARLGFADALEALPRLADALACGLLGVDAVRVLVRESEPLAADRALRWAAVHAVLDAHRADLDSGGSGLTVRQGTLRVRRAVLAADPDRAERQTERARKQRRVWHQPDTAHAEGVFALAGPVERTTECEAAVDALARAWRAAGAAGTLDQLRFDAAHHLLTTRRASVRDGDRATPTATASASASPVAPAAPMTLATTAAAHPQPHPAPRRPTRPPTCARPRRVSGPIVRKPRHPVVPARRRCPTQAYPRRACGRLPPTTGTPPTSGTPPGEGIRVQGLPPTAAAGTVGCRPGDGGAGDGAVVRPARPGDPDTDEDRWPQVLAGVLAARRADRRARAQRLTAARATQRRARAAAAAHAAAHTADAADWQARLEAPTDHQLLAELATETLADLDALLDTGVDDPTRAPTGRDHAA
jgi:hypothetical protein